MQINNHIF